MATPYTKEYASNDEGDYEALPIYELATFPDGGLRSSANDMARFLGTIMNQGTLPAGGTILTGTTDEDTSVMASKAGVGGRNESHTLLQPASVEDMLRLRHDEDIGVFWTWAEVGIQGKNRTFMGHSGSDPGAFTF